MVLAALVHQCNAMKVLGARVTGLSQAKQALSTADRSMERQKLGLKSYEMLWEGQAADKRPIKMTREEAVQEPVCLKLWTLCSVLWLKQCCSIWPSTNPHAVSFTFTLPPAILWILWIVSWCDLALCQLLPLAWLSGSANSIAHGPKLDCF